MTEEIQARLFMNLYLSQFKRRWSHTAIYLLRTRSNEPGHERYAIYRMDYIPKQSAHYLHNMTTILADRGSIVKPGQVDYSIPNQTGDGTRSAPPEERRQVRAGAVGRTLFRRFGHGRGEPGRKVPCGQDV